MSATIGTIAIRQHRRLGLLAIAGGIAYAIAGIIMMATGDDEGIAVSLLSVVWAHGAICGLVGIGLIGATGRGLFGRIALSVAMVTYALAALDALLILVGAYGAGQNPLFVLSRLGTLVGMMLVGIASVAVRRWQGWRRFSPFALLMALPLAVLLGLMLDEEMPVPVTIGLAWVVIGYAIWSTPGEASR